MSYPKGRRVVDASLIEQAVMSLDMTKLYAAPVYKFVKEEYMDSFFKTGDLRLGTLHNFRKIEEYGINRGDPSEGKNSVFQYVEHHDGGKDGTFAGQFFGKGIVVQNSTIIQHRDWPESYVFCSSRNFSEKLFFEWHAKEGTTACYEIWHPLAFALAVQKVIAQRAYFSGLDNVKYVDGHIDGASEDFKIEAPFVKPLPYAWQDEFRWVWTHRHPAISVAAHNWEIPDARQFCRKVARLRSGKLEYLWHEEDAKD